MTAPVSLQNDTNSLANPQFSKPRLAQSEPRPSSSRGFSSHSTDLPLALVDPAKNSTETSLVQYKKTTPVQEVTVVSTLVTTQVLSANAQTPSSQVLAVVWKRSIQIAQEKLSEKNLPPLSLDDQTSQTTNDVIKLTIGDLQRSIKWNSQRGARVERLGKILRTVEKYAKIVDTAIQHNPQFSSLVWAGIRAIVQVCLPYLKRFFIVYICSA